MVATTTIDDSQVRWERRALSRTGNANILDNMNGDRVLRGFVAVVVAMDMQVLGPAAADMASTLGCHRHQMTGNTTRRLRRGDDFNT